MDIDRENLSSAVCEGYDAYYRGEKIKDCPFHPELCKKDEHKAGAVSDDLQYATYLKNMCLIGWRMAAKELT